MSEVAIKAPDKSAELRAAEERAAQAKAEWLRALRAIKEEWRQWCPASPDYDDIEDKMDEVRARIEKAMRPAIRAEADRILAAGEQIWVATHEDEYGRILMDVIPNPLENGAAVFFPPYVDQAHDVSSCRTLEGLAKILYAGEAAARKALEKYVEWYLEGKWDPEFGCL